MQENPQYTDGRTATGQPIVECLNIPGTDTTYQRYAYLSDNIDEEAKEIEITDADQQPDGSYTSAGFTKGAVNVQLDKASDTICRPGHILRVDDGENSGFFIAGKFGKARERRMKVKGSIAVKKAYHPIITTYLTAEFGQLAFLTQAAGALSGARVAVPAVVNTRVGAVLAWTIKKEPGSADLPGWLIVDAATGALSGVSVAGTWRFHLICTDTVAGKKQHAGFAVIDLTIT